MKKILLKLLLSLSILACVNISSDAQLLAKKNSAGVNFKECWLKTNTIDSNDTIVFDLSQAVCSNPYFYIPVSVISDDIIYSVDFGMKYDNSKIIYDSTLSYKGYLTAAANFTSFDSTLRFTSYSFIQEIEHNTPVAAVRFNFLSGHITDSDFNAVVAYLNGDVCSFKFINPILQDVNITAGGPTAFPLGDSVLLTANTNSLCSYIWSTAETTQTISVYNSGTYTVTATNNGGCEAVAATNVLVTTPLPIQLINFYLEKTESGVDVKWSTANEINNNYFTVERSVNCINWNEVKKINGTNAPDVINHYSVSDPNPTNGINYYRLKQTDYNGTYKYSAVKTVQFFEKYQQIQVSYFPNPAVNVINVKSSADANVMIFDNKGKQALPTSVLKAGQEMKLRIDQIANGIYSLRVFNKRSSKTEMVVIEKH